ncbi:MAG: hypothetical protein ACOY0R_03990 [Chloroflexota bacterium]
MLQLETVLNFLKRPIVMTILGVLVGLILGLTIGWGIWPVDFKDSDASYLRPDLREDYLRMTIDSYRVNGNRELALARWASLKQYGTETLEAVKTNPNGVDVGKLAEFTQLTQQIQTAPPVAAPGENTETGAASSLSLGGWILSIGLIVLLFFIAAAAIYFLPRLLAKRGSGEPTITMQANEISRSAERTDFEGLGLAPPITQTMTTFMLGDDLYDESFSIDTQGGEFLGEYGLGISETIGVGDPKKVTALEVWLFDKNDIKTATKVLMSEHAFSDPGIRSRLEPKGELVQVGPHKQVMLETETLQLLATVVDIQYGEGPMPANSYFERLTLELAIWPKG